AGAQRVWDRLRGTAAPREAAAEFFERLRSRKAQVGQSLEQGRSARRFEGEGTSAPPPPGADETRPAAEPPPAPKPAAPQPSEPKEDYASRLMRDKQRAMEEREKRKET